MKARKRNAAQGFTLIELLVVISIIAVLMGLAFPAFQSVQNSAKRAQAKNDLVQIVTAVNAYYTEYGRYPALDSNYDPAASPDDSSDYLAGDDSANDRLFNLLRPSTTNPADNVIAKGNPRAISFLQLPIVKDFNNPRSGIGQNGRLYDPWGSTYRIRIDNSYNGTVTNPYSKGAGFNPITAGVIAWSIGKDKLTDASDKNAQDSKDDVISWQ
ncbi:MAG: prepilin-type N-terminal cleavage/methylation domain-containing protein [Verrucomicrobiota bacterium]|nr:prepilin-type N-terminal cleavage/methylation domain-containing protein [Verrucomicrobiota bacterium]